MAEKEVMSSVFDAVAEAFDAGDSGAELSMLMCRNVDVLLIELWHEQSANGVGMRGSGGCGWLWAKRVGALFGLGFMVSCA